MPSHPCRHGTCTNYIATPGYCPDHAGLAAGDRRHSHARYDRFTRDVESKRFYDSAAWQAARAAKLTADPLCELCGRFAQHVHHRIRVKQATQEQRLDQRLLVSCCSECHNRLEAEMEAGGK